MKNINSHEENNLNNDVNPSADKDFSTKPPLNDQEKEALSILQRVADFAERIKLSEYLDTLQNPRRLILYNFFFGVARGIGFAIGFTLLGAFTVYILNQLEILNLPLIGDFITELLKYIENSHGTRV